MLQGSIHSPPAFILLVWLRHLIIPLIIFDLNGFGAQLIVRFDNIFSEAKPDFHPSSLKGFEGYARTRELSRKLLSRREQTFENG
jgi:hypothetical protein